jgi:hypothetical protein
LGDTSGKMKQFATWFTHGVPGGAKLRGAIYHQKTGAAVLAEVDAFFQAQLAGGVDPAAEAAVDGQDGFSADMLVCD